VKIMSREGPKSARVVVLQSIYALLMGLGTQMTNIYALLHSALVSAEHLASENDSLKTRVKNLTEALDCAKNGLPVNKEEFDKILGDQNIDKSKSSEIIKQTNSSNIQIPAPYAGLEQYFTSLTYAHFKHLSVEEVLVLVEPRHKLLMAAYVNEHLRKDIANWQAANIDDDPFKRKAKPEVPLTELRSDTLDLTNMLVSSAFKDLPTTKNSIDKYLEGLKKNVATMHTVNLSDNQLLDCDMKFIKEIVEITKVKEVELSRNRLHGVGRTWPKEDFFSQLTKVLNFDFVRHINITGNPAASIDSKDFFSNLTENQLRKLIWIPEKWFSAKNWTACVPASMVQVCEQAHTEFYSKNKKLKYNQFFPASCIAPITVARVWLL